MSLNFEGNSSGFSDANAMFSVKMRHRKTPKLAQSDPILCPIAQKRAKTRKRARLNRILHKIWHPLALVLGYYQFAFRNRSVSKFETMPKILSLGP